jgi:hypothetical protein
LTAAAPGGAVDGAGAGAGAGVGGLRGDLVQQQMVAKLGDFGLAKKLKGQFAQSISGTLVYMVRCSFFR